MFFENLFLKTPSLPKDLGVSDTKKTDVPSSLSPKEKVSTIFSTGSVATVPSYPSLFSGSNNSNSNATTGSVQSVSAVYMGPREESENKEPELECLYMGPDDGGSLFG